MVYLGYFINEEGIKIDLEKIVVVIDWFIFKNIWDVCSFLEICFYYRKCVYKFLVIVKFLYKLIEKILKVCVGFILLRGV